jgi:hypothetical protein
MDVTRLTYRVLQVLPYWVTLTDEQFKKIINPNREARRANRFFEDIEYWMDEHFIGDYCVFDRPVHYTKIPDLDINEKSYIEIDLPYMISKGESNIVESDYCFHRIQIGFVEAEDAALFKLKFL